MLEMKEVVKIWQKNLLPSVIFFLFCMVISGCSKFSEKLVDIDTNSWLEDDFIMSPNGRRFAYVAGQTREMCVVIDGKKGERYHYISTANSGPGGLIFSQDNKRVAYLAKLRGRGCCVVVDEKENKTYDSVDAKSIIFSPDGQWVAYAARNSFESFCCC